jgi:hypothetical protein
MVISPFLFGRAASRAAVRPVHVFLLDRKTIVKRIEFYARFAYVQVSFAFL